MEPGAIQCYGLENMPPEILEKIITNFNADSVRHLAFTSKTFYSIMASGCLHTDKIFVDDKILRSPLGIVFRSGYLRRDDESDMTSVLINLRNLKLYIPYEGGFPAINLPNNIIELEFVATDFGFVPPKRLYRPIIELPKNLEVLSCDAYDIGDSTFRIDHDYRKISISNFWMLDISPNVHIGLLHIRTVYAGNMEIMQKLIRLYRLIIDELIISISCDTFIPSGIRKLTIVGMNKIISMANAEKDLELTLHNVTPDNLSEVRFVRKIIIIISNPFFETIFPVKQPRFYLEDNELFNLYRSGVIDIISLDKLLCPEIIINLQTSEDKTMPCLILMPENCSSKVYIRGELGFPLFAIWRGDKSTLVVSRSHQIFVEEKNKDLVSLE